MRNARYSLRGHVICISSPSWRYGKRVIRYLYSALLWDEPIAGDAQIWPVIARDHSATHSRTIPAFTLELHGITTLWLVLIVPTHRGMARLSWPERLVIYWDRFSRIGSWTPDKVTYPCTNRAWHRLTSLIETNALTSTPNRQPGGKYFLHSMWQSVKQLWPKFCTILLITVNYAVITKEFC